MLQKLIDEDNNSYNVDLEIRNIEGKNTLVAIWEGVKDDVLIIDLKKDIIEIQLT